MEIPIIFITAHCEGFFRAWIAMGVELRPDGNAWEGRASVWIFSSRSIVYLMVGQQWDQTKVFAVAEHGSISSI
jgi:hypothetical protein